MGKITMKGARVNAGLTQDEIAKKIGVTRNTVHLWESGKVKIGIPQFTMYCAVCNMSTNEVFLPSESTNSRV